MTPEGWRKRRVREFCERVKRVNVEGRDLEPLSITKDRGVILQSAKYHKRIATDSRKYVIAADGDFAFDPMSLYYGAIGRVGGIGEGLVSPDYVVFKADPTVDPEFLQDVLRFPEMHKVYESWSETGNTFGKRRRLYWSVFEEIELLLPPRPEQTKIAAILASVDDAIEASQAVIDQLAVVKRAMMTELLTRGVAGRLRRFKRTSLGTLPEHWDVAPLESLCTEKARYGANVAKGAFDPRTPRYVRITDIVADGDLSEEDKAGITEADATPYLLSEGDVVIARSGATVGKSYVYKTSDGRCAHAGYLIRFRPDARRLRVRFLGVLLQSERYWQWVREAQRTQAQPNINATEYGALAVQVPPLEEQDEIIDALSAFHARRQAETSAVTALRVVKSALLSVLLTGQVRVKPDEGAA